MSRDIAKSGSAQIGNSQKVRLGRWLSSGRKDEGTRFGMGQASRPDPTGSEAGTRSEPAEERRVRHRPLPK